MAFATPALSSAVPVHDTYEAIDFFTGEEATGFGMAPAVDVEAVAVEDVPEAFGVLTAGALAVPVVALALLLDAALAVLGVALAVLLSAALAVVVAAVVVEVVAAVAGFPVVVLLELAAVGALAADTVEGLRVTVPAAMAVPLDVEAVVVPLDAEATAVSLPLEPQPAREAMTLVARSVKQIRFTAKNRPKFLSRSEELR
jgi:hypothetical protein